MWTLFVVLMAIFALMERLLKMYIAWDNHQRLHQNGKRPRRGRCPKNTQMKRP